MHLSKTELLEKLAPLSHNRDYQGRAAIDNDLRPAAVLVPLVQYQDKTQILLTKRTDHLNNHPGQVSFPGGGLEKNDISFEYTALRETEEEIGIPHANIELLGRLPTYRTGTGFLVIPVVAQLSPGYDLVLDEFEVAEVFEAPARHVLDEENFDTRMMDYRNRSYRLFETHYNDYCIWGATAGMLVSFSRLLRGVTPLIQPELE